MRLATLCGYLIGRRQAIVAIAQDRRALLMGFLFVLSAGLAREYDGEDLLHEPWYLALPVAASLLTSLLLFLIAYSGVKKDTAPSFIAGYGMFLSLFWMTAPLAWLYAIPYERFLPPYQAVQANLWTLGIVSVWRVALMIRVVSLLMGYSTKAAFFLVMVLADLEAFIALQFLPFPIIEIMGGTRVTESEMLVKGLALNLCMTSFFTFPIWFIGAVWAWFTAKPTWQVSSPPAARLAGWPVILLPMALILLGISLLPFTQPEQILRRRVELQLAEGRIPEALAEASRHSPSDFPPHWDPPPRQGKPNPSIEEVMDVILTDPPADWLRAVYLDKLRRKLVSRFYADQAEISKLAAVLRQLPEGPGLIREALQHNDNPIIKSLQRYFDGTEPAPADIVLRNGKIITMDSTRSIKAALAIRAGKIVAVGSNKEIEEYEGAGAKVIDLKGRTVIPGIIESHAHAAGVVTGELMSPHVELLSIADIQKYVRDQASKLDKGTWIVIPRCDPTRIKERRRPTRAELDAACTTHPVLHAISSNQGLNSLGFKMVGITKDSEAPSGVEILRDDKGEPERLLNGMSYLQKYLSAPKFTTEEKLDALEKLYKTYNSVGITSIVERGTGIDNYMLYKKLRQLDRATLRCTVTLYPSGTTEEQAAKSIRDLGVIPGQGDDWFKPGPLKIRADGGIIWGNAWMRDDYGERAIPFYLLKNAQWRGRMNYTVEQMKAILRAGHKLGWQMCAHVTGDAGVDQVLEALETVAEEVPVVRQRRFTFIHAYFPDPDTAKRIKKLGACVDTQPGWYYKDADALVEVFGKERLARFIGVGEWLKAGIVTAANTDHMNGTDPDKALNPFNPFLTLYIMVSRKTEAGRVIGPDQKISRLEALRTMTWNAAYLSFDEMKAGSLEAGKFADLTILDRDYLTCPEEEIRHIKVLKTMVGGKVVYNRE